MSGFFGFDTALPEHRPNHGQQQFPPQQSKFQPSNVNAFNNTGLPDEDEMEVYTWGQGAGQEPEEADESNDATFGAEIGTIKNTAYFNFGHEEPSSSYGAPKQQSTRGPVASTASRYRPKAAADPFAFSEDDFYSSRSPARTKPKPQTSQSALTKPAGQTTSWGTAPSAAVKPSPAHHASQPAPAGQIKTLEEIEAEFASMSAPSAQVQAQAPTQPQAPVQQQILTLEELEQQMMEEIPGQAPPQHQQQAQYQAQPQYQGTPQQAPAQYQAQHQQQAQAQQIQQQPAPVREVTPNQVPGLASSGYGSQQALLDSMFPELGQGPSPAPAGQPDQSATQAPGPSPEELARQEHFRQIFESKVQAMSKHNNIMGNSDKDFITRMQLAQLASNAPFVSDFYAQVFSAMESSRRAHESGQLDRPTVVQIAAGFGLGVGGPQGNRFGKMGQNTMQKLSVQVKKLVESRAQHQKAASNSAALQGALGRVTRGGAAAPRPVLAVPTHVKSDHRPVSHLNEQTNIKRDPLTRKQIMYALEGLYADVLEIEQLRRDPPPVTSAHDVELWSAKCKEKEELIWTKLMVQEPIEVSNPHPFISLVNPPKGQRLLLRIILQLPDQKIFTLLSLLLVNFYQLDVVARAPPPPAADASLLTKADKLDRAKREADTDGFLFNIVPAIDMAINKCKLGLIGGLLVTAVQRLDVVKIASTRPGIVLFTALLSKAQSLVRAPVSDPMNPIAVPHPDPAEVQQWPSLFSIFINALLPSLPDLFPSSIAAKQAFGPSAYLLSTMEHLPDHEGLEMERREAEAWGFAAALAVNSNEEEQTALVAALREKILHTVQGARSTAISQARADLKLRNVNMFLNGLGLDAAMIE
ncbi:DNA topoisomerase 2-associated protein PAT1 [Cryptococcus wingfieldii CBS 7118]|uniref:DNA topoisomerase 2-associated protein PAT1 n=1 Tax=Cryptococcus wingfieldii CBS 7118 TaxID=1295528 RepID=A0A1E3JFA2_9TREE|nr:DNA topoisomerase 2-associated protein PAT1 [Cryptococcus wingfieldii CBS 7118]ODN99512.1 DNA topoisomerase 2-associated protein PAT1 [Cryptococcus wingfieldii CBS 7118]